MKSFIVIGLGRFGSALAVELFRLGNEVLAIDADEEMVQAISEQVTHAVVGDATDEAVLRSIGVRNFDSAIVAMAGDDIQDSILITLMLKEMNVPEVICKAKDGMHRKVLERIGADKVFLPEHDMGVRMASSLTTTNIAELFELSEELSIVELTPPDSWVNKSLKSLSLRTQYGLNILAVRVPGHDTVSVSPSADYVIQAHDILLAIGDNKSINRFRRL